MQTSKPDRCDKTTKYHFKANSCKINVKKTAKKPIFHHKTPRFSTPTGFAKILHQAIWRSKLSKWLFFVELSEIRGV